MGAKDDVVRPDHQDGPGGEEPARSSRATCASTSAGRTATCGSRVDHVVLCAGGIVTPMAAILEDQIRNAQLRTTLIWTTARLPRLRLSRTFDAIARADQKNRFDVRVFVTSGKENTADVEASASKTRSGRPERARIRVRRENRRPRRRVRTFPRHVRRRRERRCRQQVPRAPRNLRVLTRRSHVTAATAAMMRRRLCIYERVIDTRGHFLFMTKTKKAVIKRREKKKKRRVRGST